MLMEVDMNLNKLYQLIKTSGDTLVDLPESTFGIEQEGVSAATKRYLLVAKDNWDKDLFSSWNWAAFFFGWIWLVYRRAYKEAFGSFLVSSSFSSSVLGNAIHIDLWASDYFELDFYAFFLTAGFIVLYFCVHGLFGDAVYIHSLRRQLYKNHSQNLKPNIWVAIGWFVGLLLVMLLAVAARLL